MVQLPRAWARCGRPVVEVHHMLKRSRGGHLLDKYEIYHLIALCHQHHRWAETSGENVGLLIDGYVITDSIHGCPVYTGSDEYLTDRFGTVAGSLSVVRAIMSDSQDEGDDSCS
jgi:hypothetical protein